MRSKPSLTYVGGPTALLEWGGLRILTDPTFDPAGSVYELSGYALRKLQGPAVEPDQLGALDLVLLGHDHHFDTVDRAGRALLPSAGRVLTTTEAAARLRQNATGLAPWDTVEIAAPAEATLHVTAIGASRHS